MKKRTKQSLLTLSTEGQILFYTHAVSQGGEVTQLQSGEIPLKVNLMDVSPEVGACELEEALNSNGIKDRSCLFVIPPRYVTSKEINLPDGGIDASDMDDFLTIEAERVMPFANGEIETQGELFTGHDGTEKVGLIAAELAKVRQIAEVCRKAGLKLIGIVPGTCALQKLHSSEDSVVILRDSSSVHFIHFIDGVLVKVRLLTHEIDSANIDSVIKELFLQITVSLGGVPNADTIISVVGKEIECVISALKSQFPDITIENGNPQLLESVTASCDGANYETLFSAVGYLTSDTSKWADFVIAKEPPFKFLTRYPLWHKYFKQTVVVGAILLIALLSLIGHKSYLFWLEGKMARIKKNHQEILAVSKEVKHLTRWFSTKPYSLDLMKVVTEAFPERGDVWVSSISINDGEEVIVKGSAVSRSAVQNVVGNLLKKHGITNLNQGKIQSDAATKTIRFSLSFEWKGGRL